MAVQRASSENSHLETSSAEKMQIAHAEKGVNHGGLKPEDAEFLANFSDASRRKVVRKIDVRTRTPNGVRLKANNLWQIRLIPMLVVLYLLAYLDKTNIGP